MGILIKKISFFRITANLPRIPIKLIPMAIVVVMNVTIVLPTLTTIKGTAIGMVLVTPVAKTVMVMVRKYEDIFIKNMQVHIFF